jgi:hypothetical protein
MIIMSHFILIIKGKKEVEVVSVLYPKEIKECRHPFIHKKKRRTGRKEESSWEGKVEDDVYLHVIS